MSKYPKIPNGTYWHTMDWVKEMEAKGICQNSIFRKFYFDDSLTLIAGKTLPKMEHRNFSGWEHITRSSYISIMPKGRVYGRDAAIISPDNKLLWDISQDNLSDPILHPIFKEQILPPVKYISGNVGVLTYRHCDNYFHWMFDVLPRIHLLRQSNIQIEKFIVKPITTDYQLYTLNELGIPRDKLIECHDHSHLEAENLIVTSWMGSGANYPKWASDFLRNEFLKPNIESQNRNKRIYISRSNAGTRKILNEDEIFSILKSNGFEKIHLENYSVAEQIKLFAFAEVIVAPHGAGLSNLVFCSPRTKIIEIFPPTYLSGYFFIISNYRNLDYHYLIGTGEYGLENNGSVNILVNPHDLKEIVDLAKL